MGAIILNCTYSITHCNVSNCRIVASGEFTLTSIRIITAAILLIEENKRLGLVLSYNRPGKQFGISGIGCWVTLRLKIALLY